MKDATKFILVYSVVSILILVLSQIAFHPLSAEIFSYAIWLNVFYAAIGSVTFLLFGLLSRKYTLSLKVRIICYAILCLFVLNSIPLLSEKKFLTFDAVKGLLYQKTEFIDIGIHIIAITSFVVSSIVVFRKCRVAQS
ncbi:hypothetical protein A4R26_16490 [Niastella populi]|uniref:Uncharacterized protein n=1 Tax=Niastella populi TaxID=550983 RepID=A0A1V9FZB0_9BACT|nr:hypothetical protein A4R26_16490 [Niastella populi]